MQPFCLPQFEDLAVVESVNFVLEELQGGRLTRQSPGDLLPHHLHHLRTEIWEHRQVTCCYALGDAWKQGLAFHALALT